MERIAETFRDLIAPISPEEFYSCYWEKTFLHQSNTHDRFANYFSLHQIDTWFSSVRSGLPNSIVITAPEGAAARSSQYRPGDISADAAYLALAKGSSLILNYLEDWPTILGLVKALGRDFYADIGVNAYVTPKGARTFPIHTDEHDVLILHLEGEKIWHLHEFSVLELRLVQKRNLKFPQEWYGRTQTPELAEVRLQPGDLLYIPRGMPHYAVAQDSVCLHLTVSITSLHWMNFLKVAAECAALHSPEIRRALPRGFMDRKEVGEKMRVEFAGIMRIFQELTSFDEVFAAVKRNRVSFQNHPADGRFTQILESEELTADSIVERRRDVLCVVDQVFDRNRKAKASIWFANQQVAGPLHLLRALEFVRDHSRFQVGKVPGLDEKGQVTLVRRLITEGLLRRVQVAKQAEVLEEVVP